MVDSHRNDTDDDQGEHLSSGSLRRRLTYCVVSAVVVVLYLTGSLTFVERQFDDLKFSLLKRPATQDVVIVEIDARSIAEIGVWPWPRRLHAAVLERLLAAGAARVAFDVDFSALSNEADDARFARALAASDGKVVLPVFRQKASHGSEKSELIDAVPRDLFLPHVDLADLNVLPSDDGKVRHLFIESAIADRRFQSLAALLAEPVTHDFPSFAIDFGIDPATVPRLSFSDVAADNFPHADVAGKTVVVGSTAAELGDFFAVPSHATLPGPLLHVLGYESIVQGRALQRIGEAPVILMTVLLVALLGWLSERTTLARSALLALGAAMGVSGGSILLQSAAPVQLDTVPMLLAIAMTLVAAMTTRLNQQSLRLLFQTLSIRRKNAMMRNLIDKSIVGVIISDEDGAIESINAAAAKMFDYEIPNLVGESIGTLVPDLLRTDSGDASLLQELSHEVHKEVWGQRSKGGFFPVEIAANTVDIGGQVKYIAFVNDITLRRQQEEELKFRADHDELTKLPNRTKFSSMLVEALAEANETGASVAVYLLDLDRFKEVNDTLGHAVGDLLLQDVGRRLSRCMTDGATLARFGGDEFAMFLPNVVDPQKVEEFAGKIINALAVKFKVDQVNLEVGGSIGYAMYPENGETSEILLQRADIAMYSAKRYHFGFSKYWAEDDAHSVRNLTLTGDLRRAIEENELELVFQPKVKLATGTPSGAEVLCRWNRPGHGYVSPDEFIAHAEQSGLIYPLTKWVMFNALKTAAIWREIGWDLNIAVNLSARLLHHEQILGLVTETLEKWEYPAERLTLEITENALLVNPAHAMIVVREFASLGVKISIDDFGTGYSSLSYLTTLAASELKIDKSFVMGMAIDDNFKTIVKSVVAMAHDLNLSVVAEGVESDENVDTLRQFQCDIAQGYFYGRPMPPDKFEKWLKAQDTESIQIDSGITVETAERA